MVVVLELVGLGHREAREGLVVAEFVQLGDPEGADGHHLAVDLDGAHDVGQPVQLCEVPHHVLRRVVVRVDHLSLFLLRVLVDRHLYQHVFGRAREGPADVLHFFEVVHVQLRNLEEVLEVGRASFRKYL